MAKTSVFFTECSEVRSEGVDRLEMISLTSDIMSGSVSVEEATTDKKPVETTTLGGSGSVSSDNQGGMKACPTDSVENSPRGELVIAGAFITEKKLCLCSWPHFENNSQHFTLHFFIKSNKKQHLIKESNKSNIYFQELICISSVVRDS